MTDEFTDEVETEPGPVAVAGGPPDSTTDGEMWLELGKLSHDALRFEVIALRGKVERAEAAYNRAIASADKLVGELVILTAEMGAPAKFTEALDRVRQLREREQMLHEICLVLAKNVTQDKAS